MIRADEIVSTPYVEKHWEIDQEIFNQLKILKDGNGFDLVDARLPNESKRTMLGHEIKISGKVGIRIVFKFSDGSSHKVEVSL